MKGLVSGHRAIVSLKTAFQHLQVANFTFHIPMVSQQVAVCKGSGRRAVPIIVVMFLSVTNTFYSETVLLFLRPFLSVSCSLITVPFDITHFPLVGS